MKTGNSSEYSVNQRLPVPKAQVWAGRVISILLALSLAIGGVIDVMKPDFVVKAVTQMGYPESMIQPIGVVVLICVILYLIRNTAVLGAILLTGYLGGAVATHVRARRSLVDSRSGASLLCPSAMGRTLSTLPSTARSDSVSKIGSDFEWILLHRLHFY
jgi:DoxX-like family